MHAHKHTHTHTHTHTTYTHAHTHTHRRIHTHTHTTHTHSPISGQWDPRRRKHYLQHCRCSSPSWVSSRWRTSSCRSSCRWPTSPTPASFPWAPCAIASWLPSWTAERKYNDGDEDFLAIALLSALKQTHCARMLLCMSD